MKYKQTINYELSQEEIERYSRHISMPEIGLNGQRLLKASSILCVGSGGLGSPVLMYLAAIGIGRIGIVDFDVVENSNLQRQIIHKNSWIGKPKINSARSSIKEINPYCKVEIYKTVLNKNNALDIIRKYDLVCDCTDNFPSRFLINDACVILKKPNIYGSIEGFEGHATVFNLTSESPNLRDLIPEPPPIDLIPTCSERGVIGVLPGIIGLIQATEAIKIVTKIGETLNGRLLIFNAFSMKFKELNITTDDKERKIKDLKEYSGFCFDEKVQLAKQAIEKISVKELSLLIKNKYNNIIIIDVRQESEHAVDSIENSILISLESIENESGIKLIKRLSNSKKIYLYCQKGNRSLRAVAKLKTHGINGINIEGGMDAWQEEKLKYEERNKN